MSKGFIEDKCINCGSKISLCEKYDAEYCKKCDTWLIDKCSDPNCEFCKERPIKPSLVPSKKL